MADPTPSAPAPATTDAPAAETKEAPEGMTAAEKKIWKLKADGEEFEFDATDDEAVKKEIMKARGAGKRFEEATKMRRQAEQFFNMLKDPATLRQVLTDPRVGVDLKKFAEEFVWDQIQEQKLTPEQKKQRDVERELAKYKEQEAQGKKATEEREAQELHQKFASDYDKRIGDALKAANLPKTPATVQRMANYMLQAVRNGYELEPADLVEQVRKDYIEDVKALFGQTDGDQLMAILGEDLGQKIRNTDLKKLKSTQGQQFSTPTPKPSKTKDKPSKMSGDDWLKDVRKGLLGK